MNDAVLSRYYHASLLRYHFATSQQGQKALAFAAPDGPRSRLIRGPGGQ